MTDELRLERRPELRHPGLVCAFRGWNDGGQGASLAGTLPRTRLGAERFAEIDPELFFDFQATRRTLARDGLTRRIDWPENASTHARSRGGPRRRPAARDRAEPALARLQRLVVGCRDGPRRRAGGHARLAARRRAAHAARARDRERDRPRADRAARPRALPLRGPDRDRRRPPRRLPGGRDPVGVSLWAAVPHYVPLTPSPAGREGAVRAARGAARGRRRHSELDEASERTPQQVSEAVAADAETAA